MGKKERLQKELDLLLEKMRVWRYIILAIMSGTVGILFSSIIYYSRIYWDFYIRKTIIVIRQ